MIDLFLVLLYVQCFHQFDISMLFCEVLQSELVRKEDQRTAEVVEYQHGSGVQLILNLFDRVCIIRVYIYPTRYAEVDTVHTDFCVVFVLQSVFEYFELQLTYSTDYNFIVNVSVYLDCTFLCQLVYTFLELLCLHGILRHYHGEEFRREGRQRFEEEFVLCGCQGITDLV